MSLLTVFNCDLFFFHHAQSPPALSDEIHQLKASISWGSRWSRGNSDVLEVLVPPRAKALSGEMHQFTVSVFGKISLVERGFRCTNAADTAT
jgi:hypothetical protein